jgi:AraC-like DNA-binding protein
LAAAASVSERTLRTAFKEYFGVGPVHYLQLRHLHRVHRAIKAADPEEVSVSQILVGQGEWAFGRFASRYRRLFGELPSDTLRKKRCDAPWPAIPISTAFLTVAMSLVRTRTPSLASEFLPKLSLTSTVTVTTVPSGEIRSADGMVWDQKSVMIGRC